MCKTTVLNIFLIEQSRKLKKIAAIGSEMLDGKKPTLVGEEKKDCHEVKQIKSLILKMTSSNAYGRADISEVINTLQPFYPGKYFDSVTL